MIMTHAEAGDFFLAHLPVRASIAGWRFRRLDPDAREEAVQNTTALAWKIWIEARPTARLRPEALLRLTWDFAMSKTCRGRSIADLPRDRRFRRDALDRGGPGDRGRTRHDAIFLLAGAPPVPDLAADRLDFAAFLASLDPRRRALALDLATGRAGKSRHAASQARHRLHTRFLAFHSHPREGTR